MVVALDWMPGRVKNGLLVPKGSSISSQTTLIIVQIKSLNAIVHYYRWVDDATGLAPPCIAVLRSCHSLAASLTAIAGIVNSNTVPLEIVDVSNYKPITINTVKLIL